jgi:hypothetical protein
MRAFLLGVLYAAIVVGAVVLGRGGPAFLYQGF